MPEQRLGEASEELHQAELERGRRIEAEDPVRDVTEAAPGRLDDAPAHHPAPGIDAEDAGGTEHGTDV